MARYNSVNSTGSITGGNVINTPYSGLLTTITGSGNVTVPNPSLYTGQIQTFYNSTLAAINLVSPSGNFIAPGFTSASTISLPSGSIITISSDGANYITQGWLGGIGSFTSLTAANGTVTLNGSTTGSIDNVVIGANSAKAGTFNGLTNTAGTTSLAGGSASGVFTFSSSQASTAYNNGAVVISQGGLGVYGDTYHNGIIVVGTYGTPTTGAGWRTNTTDIYGQTAATDKVRISITGDSWINTTTNVGFGTSSPDLYGFGGKILAVNSGTTYTNLLLSYTGNGNNSGIAFGSQTTRHAQITAGISGSTPYIFLGVNSASTGTGVTQTLTVTSSNVGIGVPSPTSYTLQVAGTIGATGNIYSSTSDVRLKDIVRPITNAIDIIKAIETFYYRNNELALNLGLTGTDLQVGISAQSAKKVMPEVTAPAPLDPNYLTVMYERIVPFLIEAVKDQQKNIESLQEQINYLQGKQ